MNARVGLLLVMLPGLVAAQATVEYALGAGRAATTAAPAQKAGKAVGGVFGSLSNILPNTMRPKPAPRRVVPATKPVARTVMASPSQRGQTAGKSLIVTPKPQSVSDAREPKADPSLEDPSGIREAMEYGEVLHRFGPPSLKLTTGPGEETLSYARKDLTVNVMVRDGTVTGVQTTGGSGQATVKAL